MRLRFDIKCHCDEKLTTGDIVYFSESKWIQIIKDVLGVAKKVKRNRNVKEITTKESVIYSQKMVHEVNVKVGFLNIYSPITIEGVKKFNNMTQKLFKRERDPFYQRRN